MGRFVYSGRKTHEISFPLGGIGTGCIGLAGNGRLIDWEIFNRPNKGSLNGFSHFAIRAEQDGRVIDARVINSDLPSPYSGQFGQGAFQSFGFGPSNRTMAGMPHFRDVIFTGKFPIADLEFIDATFPGSVKLTAFNPFIPLNDIDSGIPSAFFEIEVTNTTNAAITYTIAATLANPLPAPNVHTHFEPISGGCAIQLETLGVDSEAMTFGDMTLATPYHETSYQDYWYRGGWNDPLETYWRDFTRPGRLHNRTYVGDTAGKENHATVAPIVNVNPGESARVRFIVSWNFPNCENYWNAGQVDAARAAEIPNAWKNYYATIWPDSMASANYALTNWDRLWSETKLFQETLFESTIPEAAIEAVSANISILKTPTVLRLEDGTLYGWEGCHPDAGCGDGSCTHVWGYQQALPFLFPMLERSMREADYQYNLLSTGGKPFRLILPLGVYHDPKSAFRPCADGQFGDVMKVYRDWKICGDDDWLRMLWPGVKSSIEFAWFHGNVDQWDIHKTGVLHGRQHHTLDMELFGPNAWLTGFYLGALLAASQMADALDEQDTAAEYRAIFKKGKTWADKNLFNGEYYCQQIDLEDRTVVDKFGAKEYWSEEHGEIKYQVADGCDIDQVLAQWHANLYGLGEIFDPVQTRTALASLFRINFKETMRDSYNAWRLYCLNDEAGLIIADWPENRHRPAIPLTYNGETQNGYEYAAAIQMIQNGMIGEGMRVVSAIRDRYDGEKRNPWNEFECGSNYARSMASYALLNAFAGFKFDMTRRQMAFMPVGLPENGEFKTFWSLGEAWGYYAQTNTYAELNVLQGVLRLDRFGTPIDAREARVGGEEVGISQDGTDTVFDQTIEISAEHSLVIVA